MNPDTGKISAGRRLTLCLLILGAGVAAMLGLRQLKTPPARKPIRERQIPVTVTTVRPVDFQVSLTGYGDLISRTTVTLAAEVSGRITASARDLEPGRLVKKDEILYTIDDRDYRLEREIAETRLRALGRELEIARAEFRRASDLLHRKKVGSKTTVEQAESTVNTIENQIAQVRKNLEKAVIDLERTRIRAPFAGRVTDVQVEENEYVTPGKPLLSLSDDTDLEVVVPLDSGDGARWLQFRDRETRDHWFPPVRPVRCRLAWSEDPATEGEGIMDRVAAFDPAARMLKVAIRLQAGTGTGPPLVAGMFCRVSIPGRTLKGVYVVPRQAVAEDATLHVVRDGRLISRQVRIIREEGDQAIVDQGLAPGERVITTRLDNPLDGTLVRIVEPATP